MVVVVEMGHSVAIAVVHVGPGNVRLVLKIGKVAHSVSCSIEPQGHGNQSSGRHTTSHTTTARDPHMYQGPHDSESAIKVATIMTVGAGATYLLYQLWG